MPRTALPITNGFYISDSLPLSAQQCVNWYVNIPQGAALSEENLYGTPGAEQLVLASTGLREVNRGADVLNGKPYFVNGTGLYRIERTVVSDLETFSYTKLGTIEGTGRVSMAQNGTQLCILVPGGKGYIFTESPDTLTEITDADFTANGDPQHVVFIDGYFLFTTDSKKFIVSDLNDGLTYSALDFGSAEADPDALVVPMVLNNQLHLAGTQSIEGFQNIGGADFPFQRTGLFIEKGVSAQFSAIKCNSTLFFIGGGQDESPAVWALQGASPVKVSTTAIDTLLQRLTDTEIEAIFAWSYAQKGAYFVGFALPNTCIVYDTITQRWHERKSNIINYDGLQETVRYRINSVVSAYGRVLVGDSQDGRVGSLDIDIYKEYERDIIRVVSTQPFQNNMQSFTVPYLELTMEAGVGNSDIADPEVRLSRSLDGKTWSDERARRIGKIGDYGHRTIWRRNGRAARFETFRFTLSDPVKPVIMALHGDIV